VILIPLLVRIFVSYLSVTTINAFDLFYVLRVTGATETGWANAEIRGYQFVHGLESTADDNASIKEMEESRKKRLKQGPKPKPSPIKLPAPGSTELAESA
jgi:hypothetical protein